MQQQYKTNVLLILFIVVIATSTLAFYRRSGAAEASITTNGKKTETSSDASPQTQSQPVRSNSSHRNLSLHPEAFKMARRLGQRFSSAPGSKTILVGNLTKGSQQRIVETTRTQSRDGEHVAIQLADSLGALTWDAAQGALSTLGRATGGDRELIERLALDSPDQFVLAQLRGASYYTIARNVRAAAPRDFSAYDGPLWTIVRIGDPDKDNERRPESKWRLYYINEATGLVDKIIGEVGGQRVEANFRDWRKFDGEMVPTRITWTRDGQTLMELTLSNFARLSA